MSFEKTSFSFPSLQKSKPLTTSTSLAPVMALSFPLSSTWPITAPQGLHHGPCNTLLSNLTWPRGFTTASMERTAKYSSFGHGLYWVPHFCLPQTEVPMELHTPIDGNKPGTSLPSSTSTLLPIWPQCLSRVSLVWFAPLSIIRQDLSTLMF